MYTVHIEFTVNGYALLCLLAQVTGTQLRLGLLLPIIERQTFHLFYWTQDCCWMAVDEQLLDELQIETPIKSILNDQEVAHLARNNAENVQNHVNKEE